LTKIVYNTCHGAGFCLSDAAVRRYAELKPLTLEYRNGDYYLNYRIYEGEDIPRNDPVLHQVIDELGLEASSGPAASLEIIELNPGTPYRIQEYDGVESIITFTEQKWFIA
jgi:hypothetical protein